MILIVSEEIDITTNEVVDWLLYFKTKYTIQNAKTLNILNSFIINNKDVSVSINNKDLDTVNKIWQRRGNYGFFKPSLKKITDSKTDLKNLADYLYKEEKVIGTCIENHQKIIKDEYIGSFNTEVNNNKLEVLIAARKNGLLIPDTLVTSNKTELLKFYKEHNCIITKDLKSPVFFELNGNTHTSVGTFVVSELMINNLTNNFFPVFVQDKVEKEFEIRVFCYQDKMFSMAIFSQKDQKTAVDYRNYNDEKPNRCVPIKLPNHIEKKLLQLQLDLNINTCSIDIIYNQLGEYVFLEINPMGQLDWVSKNCNYYIEKQIAESLSKT